jgi:hypothetical protein
MDELKSDAKSMRGYVVIAKLVLLELIDNEILTLEDADNAELSALSYSNLDDLEEKEYWDISGDFDEQWGKADAERESELEWRLHHWGKYMSDGYSPKDAVRKSIKLNYELWSNPKSQGNVIDSPGSLVHVFTHPEMYDLTNMGKGPDYIFKVQETATEMHDLMDNEGIEYIQLVEDWVIHRILQNHTDEDLMYKPETLYEGLAVSMKCGIDISTSVAAFVEEAYNEIADSRVSQQLREDLPNT